MTENEFKADDKLVSELRRLFDNPVFRLAASIVKDSGPASSPTPPGIDVNSAFIRLGRIEQHTWTLNQLLSLSKHPVDLNIDNAEMELDESKE